MSQRFRSEPQASAWSLREALDEGRQVTSHRLALLPFACAGVEVDQAICVVSRRAASMLP